MLHYTALHSLFDTEDHRISWNPTDSGLHHTPPPPIVSPYTDHCVTPAHVSSFPGPGASIQVPQLCFDNSPSPGPSHQTNRSDYGRLGAAASQPVVQSTMVPAPPPQVSQYEPTAIVPPQSFPLNAYPEMQTMQQPNINPPINPPYPTEAIQCNSHVYTSYAYPAPEPQVPAPRFETPQTINIMNNPPAAGQTLRWSDYERTPQSHMSQAAVHYPHDLTQSKGAPRLHSVTSAWGPNMTAPNPLNVTYAAHTQAPAPRMPASDRQVSSNRHFLHQSAPLPPYPTHHTHSGLSEPLQRTPGRALTHPSIPLPAYGGFMQTHQVKNVQVFTGNADSKMLIEDWICDLQYLLEAVELPMHLRFSTAVRHLGGEARKLVLNLPPHDQTPEKAFEELRAEYGDTQGSLL
ncbi:hypothetical protein NQZ68_036915 [Dissostichus eleginoides]|nr:hypothetical protein NQZ68_036915 [Dissostichus eleginoides]